MKKRLHPLVAGYLMCAIGVATSPAHDLSHAVETSPAIGGSVAMATVVGTVRDEAGKPLIGAIVALLEPHSRGRELQSVKTDLKGRFSAAVVPGSYRLRATAEGFSSKLTRINLDGAGRMTYDIALRRTNTLVDKRGDSEDYRWIARSVPRQVLNLRPNIPTGPVGLEGEERSGSFVRRQPSFHGIAQFMAVQSSLADVGPGYFGLNFAVSGSLDGNVEMALIGQRGTGQIAPQRLMAIASMRTSDQHKMTASIGYGQTITGRNNLLPDPIARSTQPAKGLPASLDQISVTALGEWQASPQMLLIYGLDYSSFIGSLSRPQESLLPRVAIQYSPGGNMHLKAATTPGRHLNRQSLEEFKTENLQTNMDLMAPEVAMYGTAGSMPRLDRSRRYETGFEKVFRDGNSAIEASAFYDLISGHGVGVMALPLEVSPVMEQAFQRITHQVTAMNGAARGGRILYRHQISNNLTATFGYSVGGGTQLRRFTSDNIRPGDIFQQSLFQVGTAKLDLDLNDRTGTRISTVVRFSPTAVVFAIDPFAGRLGVYDPNINIYVTQELPSFGLPIQWEAIFDLRNLLNQTTAVERETIQLLATRNSRTIRGGLAFRW